MGDIKSINNLLAEHPLSRDYPDAVVTLGVDGKFLSANKALLEIAECSYEELSNLNVNRFLASSDLGKVLRHFIKSLRGEILNYDTMIVLAKGNVKYLNLTHLPILSGQRVIGVHVIAKEITLVVLAGQKIRQQQLEIDSYNKKMSAILESITDGFFAVDRDWTVTYWNKAAEQILQLSRNKVNGKHLWDVYPKKAYSTFYAAYCKAMLENVSIHIEEYLPEQKLWLEVSAFPSDEGLSVYFKDITARKLSEANANEAKRQYQNLFDLSPLPQFVYGSDDLKFKDVNQAAILHYGYSKAEFLSMSIKDIRPPEDLALLAIMLKEHVKPGAYHKGIVRHVKKNGAVIYVQVEGNAIDFEGVSSRLVIAVDMTEKLNAQKALQDSERRFKALIQNGSDLIAILDESGKYKYVNQTSESILGIPADFFIGKHVSEFIHQEDRAQVLGELSQLSNNDSIKLPAFRFKIQNGGFCWIESVITNMMDDPAVGGIVANSRVVTERIESELKIKQSIKRFETVSKATSDAIFDYDLSTGFVLWNKAIKGLFGYKQVACTYDWWKQRVHPDDIESMMNTFTSTIKENRKRLVHEYRFRCADNNYKSVLDRSFLIYNEQGELTRMIGSMQDITDRMKYIRTVEAQNQRLKDIAWTQSHIVRAPLSNMLGVINLLLDEMMEDDPKKELVYLMSRLGTDLDMIIQNIIRETEAAYKFERTD
jgi:PAS domain S-box-containing protein